MMTSQVIKVDNAVLVVYGGLFGGVWVFVGWCMGVCLVVYEVFVG